MERQRNKNAMVIWVLLVGLFSHNMAMCRNLEEGVNDDQKNYYTPDPHKGGTPKSPPKRSHESPPSCGTPPSKGGGGGGYYRPPPPYGRSPPIATPPTIVSPPSYGGQTPPYVSTPPSVDPGTPSTPMIPSTPPFKCYFWKTHPQMIWALFGYWGTVGGVFGMPTLLPNLSLQQALSTTRSDGMGSLYREGTAALLNSMATNKFPFTTQQVKDKFLAALSSDNAAAAQAQLFKLANEGRMKNKP